MAVSTACQACEDALLTTPASIGGYFAEPSKNFPALFPEGSLFDNVGPLVDSTIDDKPLSVALHEINEDKLTVTKQQQPTD